MLDSIKVDWRNTIGALWVTTLGLSVVTPQYFWCPGDLCEIVAVTFSHWKAISWSRYAETVHVWYCLVHSCFLNEGVNKNSSLRVLSWISVFFLGGFLFFHTCVIFCVSSFSAFYCSGNLSGALGHYQSYKRHNVMEKHINESKCQR